MTSPPPASSNKWFLFAGLGCLGVLLLGGCIFGGALLFFARTHTATPTEAGAPPVPPAPAPADPLAPPAPTPPPAAESAAYAADPARFNPKLKSHYHPFTFQIPGDWKTLSSGNAPADNNFVKIQKTDDTGSTVASFAVGYFTTDNPITGDSTELHDLAAKTSAQFAAGFPEFRQTAIGAVALTPRHLDGYQFLFTSKASADGEDHTILGRCIFLPRPGPESKDGYVLLLIATDKSGLTDPAQLGESGDLATPLNSFSPQ